MRRDEVIKFLRELKNFGFLTAACSSSRSSQLVLERLDLESYFDTIVTGWDITREKPDPQIYLLAAERLQISPKICVVFEDTLPGVMAAKRAEMKVIAVKNQDLADTADMVIDSYDEIDIEEDIF